jgi:hemerythrin-like domain-containing protein
MAIQLGAPPQHGFDQPLGLLSDCHRRMEHFLGILRKIAEPEGGPLDNEKRDAVEVALTYFHIAAPRHNEDEEQSLFPLLRKRSDPAVVAALEVINSLEAEHVIAAAAHNEVDRLYRQWIEADSLPDPERLKLKYLLDELIQMYQRHIAIEDKKIFPLAAQMLGVEERGRLGREMAERRGIKLAQHPPTAPKELSK